MGAAGSCGSQRLQQRHDASSGSQMGTPAAAGPSQQQGADDTAVQAAADQQDEVRQPCCVLGVGGRSISCATGQCHTSGCMAGK